MLPANRFAKAGILLLLSAFTTASPSIEAKSASTGISPELASLINTASSRIKNVIVLMMENRSFDHILGWLKQDYNSQIEGLDENMLVPRDPKNPSKGYVPITRAGYDVGPDDPLHDYDSIHAQIDNNSMDGFVLNALNNDHNESNPVSMFDSTSAPILNSLARSFAVFDHWHCSVPGPTDPNRGYAMSGTSQGVLHNFNGTLWTQQSYFDLLNSNNVPFGAYYQQDMWAVAYFEDMKKPENSQYMKDLDTHFYKDLAAGDLAPFVWLQPRLNAHAELPTWQHPDASVIDGERLIKSIYEALRASPIWNQSVFIITYDEHGGFYDHVPPPTGAPNPDGLKNENGFNFDQLGIRIPTVAISPWIAANTIVSQPFKNEQPTPNSQFESTSIMSTAHSLLGLTTSNVPLLGKRAEWSNTFLSLFTQLDEPRTDCPTTLPNLPNEAASVKSERLQAQRAKPISDHLHHQVIFLCMHNYPELHKLNQCPGLTKQVLQNQGTASDWIVKETPVYAKRLRDNESAWRSSRQTAVSSFEHEISSQTI